LTGVGAGAALSAALNAGGFGGETDGFYQRRGCGLSKVSGYGGVTHGIRKCSPLYQKQTQSDVNPHSLSAIL